MPNPNLRDPQLNMKAGRRLEKAVSASLGDQADWGHRLDDGGPYGRNRQPGDFLAMNEGHTYVIECKSTKLPHPLALDRITQLRDLVAFDRQGGATAHAVIVAEFHEDDYKAHDRAFAIHAETVLALKEGLVDGFSKRSLNEYDCSRYGIELPKLKRGRWDLGGVWGCWR